MLIAKRRGTSEPSAPFDVEKLLILLLKVIIV